ncbi:hypothetical protein QQG55_27070 [Brugia pahangi]
MVPRAGIYQATLLRAFNRQRKEDKLRRIQLCVTTLESINDKWFTYTQQIVTMKRREEEEAINLSQRKTTKSAFIIRIKRTTNVHPSRYPL